MLADKFDLVNENANTTCMGCYLTSRTAQSRPMFLLLVGKEEGEKGRKG